MKNVVAASNKKARRHFKRNASLIVVGLLIVAGATWFAVARIQHQRAVDHQRAQFTQAEKDLDALTQSIITKFGEPEQKVKTKNCNYTSPFYEFAAHGTLYCYVDTTLVYTSENVTNAKQTMLQMENLSYGHASFQLANESTQESMRPPLDLGADKYTWQELECATGYEFFTAGNDMQVFGFKGVRPLQNGQALLVELNCEARPSVAQYFPLAK